MSAARTSHDLDLAEKKHDYLSDVLKGHWNKIVDVELKHAAFLTVVLGWLFTHEPARKFLTEEFVHAARWGFAAYLVLHVFWLIGYYRESRTTHGQLRALNYMPEEYYDAHRIKMRTLASFLALDLGMATTVFALLFMDAVILPILMAAGTLVVGVAASISVDRLTTRPARPAAAGQAASGLAPPSAPAVR